MPTSKHHDIDLEDPLVAMRYLGDPVDHFIALAEADGWTVERYGDCESATTARERARYDEIVVRSRNGRVTAIGHGAQFEQPQDRN